MERKSLEYTKLLREGIQAGRLYYNYELHAHKCKLEFQMTRQIDTATAKSLCEAYIRSKYQALDIKFMQHKGAAHYEFFAVFYDNRDWEALEFVDNSPLKVGI